MFDPILRCAGLGIRRPKSVTHYSNEEFWLFPAAAATVNGKIANNAFKHH
jgi:hypothetical protein